MSHGGKRIGAGRKPGYAAIEAERTRLLLVKKIAKQFNKIVDPQIQKAKKGDTFAFKELMNRAFGMPRQNVGIDGGLEGEPVEYKEVGKMSPQEIDEYLREKLTGSSN